ncbi:MAG TPA: hypothetical protein PLI45_00360 [Candidatus Woesebacteria bacterium]|nr:hypothetical protein [Candidatus Woesebacteria bacterium]
MAVKMIRHGNSIFPIEITCKKCHGLVCIGKPTDLRIVVDYSTETTAVTNCPDCKSQIVLYDSDQAQAIAEVERAQKR